MCLQHTNSELPMCVCNSTSLMPLPAAVCGGPWWEQGDQPWELLSGQVRCALFHLLSSAVFLTCACCFHAMCCYSFLSHPREGNHLLLIQLWGWRISFQFSWCTWLEVLWICRPLWLYCPLQLCLTWMPLICNFSFPLWWSHYSHTYANIWIVWLQSVMPWQCNKNAYILFLLTLFQCAYIQVRIKCMMMNVL